MGEVAFKNQISKHLLGWSLSGTRGVYSGSAFFAVFARFDKHFCGTAPIEKIGGVQRWDPRSAESKKPRPHSRAGEPQLRGMPLISRSGKWSNLPLGLVQEPSSIFGLPQISGL